MSKWEHGMYTKCARQSRCSCACHEHAHPYDCGDCSPVEEEEKEPRDSSRGFKCSRCSAVEGYENNPGGQWSLIPGSPRRLFWCESCRHYTWHNLCWKLGSNPAKQHLDKILLLATGDDGRGLSLGRRLVLIAEATQEAIDALAN